MKPIEVQLLESLGSGVRPFDVAEVSLPEVNPDFGKMLHQAKMGNPQSGLGVMFSPAVSGEFSQEEQKEIAHAIDRAAVVGVERALILHNRRTLRVDVSQRIVLEATPIKDNRVIEEIDGFVVTQSQIKDSDSYEMTESDQVFSASISPARIVRNASLVHALAGRVDSL